MTYSVLRRFSTLVASAFVFLGLVGVVGCSRAHPGPPHLPVPAQSTVVGPGDLFEVSVMGEKE